MYTIYMSIEELEQLARKIIFGETTDEEYARFIRESERIIADAEVVFAS
mgnify:CR=1 FL=1